MAGVDPRFPREWINRERTPVDNNATFWLHGSCGIIYKLLIILIQRSVREKEWCLYILVLEEGYFDKIEK